MHISLVNLTAALIILFLVGSACYYIYSEKKKGTRCIGCPIAGRCEKTKVQMRCASSKKEFVRS